MAEGRRDRESGLLGGAWNMTSWLATGNLISMLLCCPSFSNLRHTKPLHPWTSLLVAAPIRSAYIKLFYSNPQHFGPSALRLRLATRGKYQSPFGTSLLHSGPSRPSAFTRGTLNSFNSFYLPGLCSAFSRCHSTNMQTHHATHRHMCNPPPHYTKTKQTLTERTVRKTQNAP